MASPRDDPGAEPPVGHFGVSEIEQEPAGLIADVVRVDAPYYDAVISEGTVVRLNQFAQDMGRLEHPVKYEQVMATEMRPLWRPGSTRRAD